MLWNILNSDRVTAKTILSESEKQNPGPWGNHSRMVAKSAEAIAKTYGDINAERAYTLGLLLDIGRRYGIKISNCSSILRQKHI